MADKDRGPRRNEDTGSAGEEGGRDPTGITSTTDRNQPSALGGDVATRSNTAETEDGDEADDAE